MIHSARCRGRGSLVLSAARSGIPAFAKPGGKIVAALTIALCATLTPALAQDEVKIGTGFGLAFLPVYICEDLKLVEKYGHMAGLNVKASFPRFMGAAQMQDALASGTIAMAPFGTAPLLAAWETSKDTPNQIVAVSGITSLPLILLSDRSDEQSLADLKPDDRIAMPTLSSPQMYVLEMQSEKIFGQYDKLRGQAVALSHADAIAALMAGAGEAAGQATGQDAERVTAYFSSPPFTQLALREAIVHPLLNSSDVMGKSSFLIMGATKATIEAQPQMPQVMEKAMDEAARLIHDDPRHAAQIFLTHEPSGSFDSAAMAAAIKDIKDEFGSAIYGVQTMADFMGRHGELKSPPRSWKDIVAPALLSSPST
jgi:NitT/TauT family transport system substrate-binding protein